MRWLAGIIHVPVRSAETFNAANLRRPFGTLAGVFTNKMHQGDNRFFADLRISVAGKNTNNGNHVTQHISPKKK